MPDIPQQEPNFGESESYNWNDRVYRLKNTDSVLARNPDDSNAASNLATQTLVNRSRNLHKRITDIEANNWVVENRIADGALTRRKVMSGARAIGATISATQISADFRQSVPLQFGNESNIFGNPYAIEPVPGASAAPFVRLWRDISNRVFLDGFFSQRPTGTPTGLIFTLPTEFRPKDLCVFVVTSATNGAYTIQVNPGGAVNLVWLAGSGNAQYPVPVPLNSISFVATDSTMEFGVEVLPQ
jgi:hypothetical protein